MTSEVHDGIPQDKKDATTESRHGILRRIPWPTSGGTDSSSTPVERNGTHPYKKHHLCLKVVTKAKSVEVGAIASLCLRIADPVSRYWHLSLRNKIKLPKQLR